jgi:catechol 2,3-dioxygenase-like lactoylglutathione lyase family enzyme
VAVATLDHTIVPVVDLDASLRFYTDVLGLEADGTDGPFSVVRVDAGTVLLLAPWGSEGGLHLAFALSPEEFAATFDRIKSTGVPYGDSFHDAANGRGPGEEQGARGLGPTLYLLDPSGHLVEIRHY